MVVRFSFLPTATLPLPAYKKHVSLALVRTYTRPRFGFGTIDYFDDRSLLAGGFLKQDLMKPK